MRPGHAQPLAVVAQHDRFEPVGRQRAGLGEDQHARGRDLGLVDLDEAVRLPDCVLNRDRHLHGLAGRDRPARFDAHERDVVLRVGVERLRRLVDEAQITGRELAQDDRLGRRVRGGELHGERAVGRAVPHFPNLGAHRGRLGQAGQVPRARRLMWDGRRLVPVRGPQPAGEDEQQHRADDVRRAPVGRRELFLVHALGQQRGADQHRPARPIAQPRQAQQAERDVPAHDAGEAEMLQVDGLARGRNLDRVRRRRLPGRHADPLGRPDQPAGAGQIHHRMHVVPARLARLQEQFEVVQFAEPDVERILDEAAVHPAFAHRQFRARHQNPDPGQFRLGQHARPRVHHSELAADGHRLVHLERVMRKADVEERHAAHADERLQVVLAVCRGRPDVEQAGRQTRGQRHARPKGSRYAHEGRLRFGGALFAAARRPAPCRPRGRANTRACTRCRPSAR